MSEARIWYSRDANQVTLPGGLQNEIILSHEFFNEIMSHPIPTDMEAAKALSCSPAALDLFMWLSYRCFMAKGRELVPLFGAFGLVNQLGSSDYARPRKFRERLEGWLDLVRTMWPECPAAIDTTGTGLWVDRASAVWVAVGISVSRYPPHRSPRAALPHKMCSNTFHALIGIGAAVARRPLPHHRAYGSVHGGSRKLL